MPFRAALLALLVIGLAACIPVGGSNLSASGPVSIDGPGGLGPVNAYRARNGLGPLTVDERLMRAAEVHSRSQASRGRLGHNVGGNLPSRVQAQGYRWVATAENVGGGYPSYQAAMRGWINSPGHRRNLLNPNVTEFGVGVARSPSGVPYWTQIFARER